MVSCCGQREEEREKERMTPHSDLEEAIALCPDVFADARAEPVVDEGEERLAEAEDDAPGELERDLGGREDGVNEARGDGRMGDREEVVHVLREQPEKGGERGGRQSAVSWEEDEGNDARVDNDLGLVRPELQQCLREQTALNGRRERLTLLLDFALMPELALKPVQVVGRRLGAVERRREEVGDRLDRGELVIGPGVVTFLGGQAGRFPVALKGSGRAGQVGAAGREAKEARDVRGAA